LFQILLGQGVFTVLMLLYRNYILGLGKAKLLVVTEIVRDLAAIVAIIMVFPYIGLESPESPVEGLKYLLCGQFVASAITWGVTLYYVIRLTKRSLWAYMLDIVPYFFQTVLISIPCAFIGNLNLQPLIICLLQAVIFAGLYLGGNFLMNSKIQRDAIDYLKGRL
ncbi:MAG: hypothetical protein K2G17_02230, partial [Duncaniella sp.]|nr:hypothetical protein [Duncaniella sp.]